MGERSKTARLLARSQPDDKAMRNLSLVALTDAGVPGKDLAALFSITPEHLSRLRARVTEEGSAGPAPSRWSSRWKAGAVVEEGPSVRMQDRSSEMQDRLEMQHRLETTKSRGTKTAAPGPVSGRSRSAPATQERCSCTTSSPTSVPEEPSPVCPGHFPVVTTRLR